MLQDHPPIRDCTVAALLFFFKTRIQNVDETTWTDEEDASSTIALIDQHMYKYANQTILLDGAAVCLALHHR